MRESILYSRLIRGRSSESLGVRLIEDARTLSAGNLLCSLGVDLDLKPLIPALAACLSRVFTFRGQDGE